MPDVTPLRRSIPVSLLAVVALGAAALAPALASSEGAHSESHAAHAGLTATHQGPDHRHGHPHGGLNARELVFHDQMRKLWEDHITWTRLAIVTFADGSAGFDATAARLLQNQTDIGDAIKPFYGEAAGDQLTALLHDHITIAVELLQAAKAGDTAGFEDAKTRWYANANDIADFLAAANPRFWPRFVIRELMRVHLDQTLAEAQDELTGQYAASVNDYEAIHAHILHMADLLSFGILKTFPWKFH
jgi:hypothetical protein